jgi:hypothetical protein
MNRVSPFSDNSAQFNLHADRPLSGSPQLIPLARLLLRPDPLLTFQQRLYRWHACPFSIFLFRKPD